MLTRVQDSFLLPTLKHEFVLVNEFYLSLFLCDNKDYKVFHLILAPAVYCLSQSTLENINPIKEIIFKVELYIR